MVRTRVIQSPEAALQLASLAPQPKREVRARLREMTRDPYGPSTKPLDDMDEPTFRVRVDGYRILFRPGPGVREITVFRIRPRETAYDGLEGPEDD